MDKVRFTWSRKGMGYEVSSRGDKRFSALYARMPDGRTIEQHYQCDVKGYDPGGTDWKLGKGLPPAVDISKEDLYLEYKKLWSVWAGDNLELMRELYVQARLNGSQIKDMFATSPVNQARALSEILNELCS